MWGCFKALKQETQPCRCGEGIETRAGGCVVQTPSWERKSKPQVCNRAAALRLPRTLRSDKTPGNTWCRWFARVKKTRSVLIGPVSKTLSLDVMMVRTVTCILLIWECEGRVCFYSLQILSEVEFWSTRVFSFLLQNFSEENLVLFTPLRLSLVCRFRLLIQKEKQKHSASTLLGTVWCNPADLPRSLLSWST